MNFIDLQRDLSLTWKFSYYKQGAHDVTRCHFCCYQIAKALSTDDVPDMLDLRNRKSDVEDLSSDEKNDLNHLLADSDSCPRHVFMYF